ncbi:MAG: MobF family relaxase, partial [Acidimicrobiales bacterium]
PQAEVDRLRDARRPTDARAGWDVVLRPPKGYSVLWAVGGAELGDTLVAIHHQAVETALSYLEDAAATARTTATVGGERKRVRTAAGGFVVAAFDHRDSRAGDPLLHTHCVIANATRMGDGHWAGVDPVGLYRHGLAADAVYQASFRHLAEYRLGLAADTVIRGWADVAGVPRSVVEHFSKRSEDIAAELERLGSDSPAARQAAALATRAAKGLREGDAGLHERWRVEAAEIGFGAPEVAACLGRTAGVALTDGQVEAAFDRLGGPHGLTECAATFGRADVICALAGALGTGADGEALVSLADAFLASDRVTQVREHRAGMPRPRLLDAPGGAFVDHLADAAFTTPDLAAVERRLMAAATEADTAGPVLSAERIEATLAARPRLSDEQRAMVRAVCASPTRLRPVVGYPGAGKTYATEAVVAAFGSAGIPVIACAVTAEAADELARATGLTNGACDTVARTLVDLDHPVYGGLAPGTVVILDEASTAGHRDLERLVTHVEAAGGALVLVGDPHQHGAVGPGHFFAWLVGRDGGALATLADNHRQRDVVGDDGSVVVSMAPERSAIEAFREGRVAESFARRDAVGLITRAASAPELY